MAARSSAATGTAAREFVITRIFDAPRELVFTAWTDPDRAARWWGPRGFTTVSCEMDVRPGGAWRKGMRSPDGTVYWKHGVYREFVEPERLVFTYVNEDAEGRPGQEMLVTVTFAEHGAKTKLTLRQTDFDTVDSRDAHLSGWTSCMERFAEYLASDTAV